jgi:hypothetical protein
MRTGTPSQFNDASLTPFIAIEMDFDSGTLRLWNGYRDITIDGNTFIGSGTLLAISQVEETGEVSAKGVSITLSGISSEIISVALSEKYQNRTARIYLGAIADNGDISSYQLFAGRLDVMSIEDGGDTATVSVTAENRLIDLERPRIRRFTAEDQKSLYPSDLGLDYVNDLQDKTLDWGKST